MNKKIWLIHAAALFLLVAAGPGCDDGNGDTTDADTEEDTGGEDHIDQPPDVPGEDMPPPDTPVEDVSPPDTPVEDVSPPDTPEEDISDMIEEEGPPPEVTVVGRVWNYFSLGTTVGYGYPWVQVTVSAFGAGSDPLVEALTDIDSCVPWDPPDPYLCGYFEMVLDGGTQAMLKATDNYGYKDTLTQIFVVRPGTVRIIVMTDDSLVTMLQHAWGATIDLSKGFVTGIVARTSGDVHAEPFTEMIADATVQITPDADFESDFMLVYYDTSNPTSTSRTATDPDNPIFVALNLPPRSFDEPYEITVSHSTYSFEPVRFSVQPDVLTYLILSPSP